jgi:hypothetical protein
MALPLNTHTQNYVFGRGRLFIGVYSDDTSRADRRYIGNCPGFELEVESEVFEHFSSTSGIQTKDLTVTKSVAFNASITCDDIQAANLALFLGGTNSTLTQVATPVTNEAIIVQKGYHYQLGQVSTNKVGIRDVTSVVVTNVAGSTTYVLNTDYALDAASGMIFIITAGAITDSQTIHVDYTPTAGARDLVTSGTSGAIDAEVFFVADNANGDNRDLRIPLASIAPSGALPFITEDSLGTMTFAVGISTQNSDTAQVYIAGRRV